MYCILLSLLLFFVVLVFVNVAFSINIFKKIMQRKIHNNEQFEQNLIDQLIYILLVLLFLMVVYEIYEGLANENVLEFKSENENTDYGTVFNGSIVCNNRFKYDLLTTPVPSPAHPQHGTVFDSDAKDAESSTNSVWECEFNVNENGNNIYDCGQICIH